MEVKIFDTFINGNVPSLKNSKVKTDKGIFHSKTVKKYLSSLGIQSYSPSKKLVKGYAKKPNLFALSFNDSTQEFKQKEEDGIFIVEFYFIRDSKRKFDYINAMQIVLDLMTAHGFIIDDSCDFIIPRMKIVNNKGYEVDKNNPGVQITIYKYTNE